MTQMPIEEIRESNRRRKEAAYGVTTDSRDIDALLAEIDRLRMMIQKAIDAPHEDGCGCLDMTDCDCRRALLVDAILRKALE